MPSEFIHIYTDKHVTFKEKIIDNFVSNMNKQVQKILLIPPDFTRFQSQTGDLTNLIFKKFEHLDVDIIPALGTHTPMTDEEKRIMFPDIPLKRLITHNWREDVMKIGEVSPEVIEHLSDGKINYSVNVEINNNVINNEYDAIISLGQVVPHEVAGMSNGVKNILIGLGGKDFIDKSHYLGAVTGMERIMGTLDNPVRKLLSYANEKYIKLPLYYILTVIKSGRIQGLYLGNSNEVFKQAASNSQNINITRLEKPNEKVIVYLDPKKYKSTWLGNKAIYRTRMMIKDRGKLIILAPGIQKFGEDENVDDLIHKYGYLTTKEIIKLVKEEKDLHNNLAVAAHLIHGSSENRFSITYCTSNISKEEVESVNYQYGDLSENLNKYDPNVLSEGYNTLSNDKEIYYIKDPSQGLWVMESNNLKYNGWRFNND